MATRFGHKSDFLGSSPTPAAAGYNVASRSPDPLFAAAAASNNNNNNNNNTSNNSQLIAAQQSGGGFNAYRGRSASESQQNFEHALESQGLTSASVELGLLQSKLRSAHTDLQRARTELKEAQERASALSAQLNQQKIENSSLTHQYSALLAKLTDTEAAARRFDEEIATERNSHNATREVLESERNLSMQREQSLNQHITALENKLQHMQHTAATAAHDITSRHLGGGNSAAGLNRDTEEAASAHDRYVRLSDVLTAQLDGTLEQLLAQLSEDESGVFVTKSMVMSTASELESRLAQAEFKLRSAALAANDVRDVDDQVVAFTSSLLGENKELWNNVCRLQQEADQLQQELNAARHRERGLTEAAPLREHIAYLEQQNAALEEAAKACRLVVDEQTERAREHEVAAQRIMDELRILTQKYEALLVDRNALQRVLDEACATAQEATTETEQLREENANLRNECHSLRSRVETVEHEMRTDSDLRINELIEKVRGAQVDRDEAQRERDQLGFQLDESRGTESELRRVIAQRDETIVDLQRSLEEMHQQCLTTLEHQITAQRAVYQKEIDELRSNINDLSSSRSHAPPGLVEDLKNEIRRLEAEREMHSLALRDRENESLSLRDHLRQLSHAKDAADEKEKESAQRAAASARETERVSAEMRRLAAAVEAESGRHGTKLMAAEAEVARLQEQLLESERSRQQHMEELRLTRQSIQGGAISDDTLRQLRLKYEKDRAEMAAENERLQQQLRQLHQKHIELLENQRGVSAAGGGAGGHTNAAQHAREISNLQAKLEAQTRKLNELEKRREDTEQDKRKMVDHIRQLQGEKQVLETRMDHIVTQVRKEQELDLGGPVRSSMSAHRRLQDQIGEMERVGAGGGGGGGGGAYSARPSPAGAAASAVAASSAFPRRPPPPVTTTASAPVAVGSAATTGGAGAATAGGGAGTPTTATSAFGSHWRP